MATSTKRRQRPSPSMFVAVGALVMAMSGAAVALPGKGSVDKNDLAKGAVTKKAIKKGAVTKKAIKKKAVTKKAIKDGAVTREKIADGAVNGSKVEDGSLSSDKLSDVTVVPLTRMTATDGANEAAARDAAPAQELYAKGQLAIYAKCFRDSGTDTTYGEIFIATIADGAIFDGSTDELSGGPAATDFLNTSTPETDRELDGQDEIAPDAIMDEGEFNAVSADGTTHLLGQTTVAVKAGNLAGGNGAYGDGNVCLFGLEVNG